MKLNVGNYLKRARKTQKMTLAQLSDKSSVALATISRIEAGKMTGTVESHMQLAKALGLSLPQFYSEVEKSELSQKQSKQESQANTFVQNKDISSTILTKDIFSKKMLPLLIELKPEGKTNKEKLSVGTEKFLYILSGKVEVVIGESKETLAKGTTLYFDASQSHHIKNIDNKEALCLCVVTPANL